MRLSDKRALVTGAAGAIGSAICSTFIEQGAKVAALDLQLPSGGDCNLRCDLSSGESLERCAEEVRAQLGSPDILVHAAALSDFADTLSAEKNNFQRVMEVNVYSAMQLAQLFAPSMAEKRSGSCIFVSSITGVQGAPGMACYAASKGALNTAVKTLALELAADNIRVNSICPASVDTPMLRASFERNGNPQAAMERNILRHPLGRLGSPQDIANLALFLASDESAWITGTNILIDGGAAINRR